MSGKSLKKQLSICAAAILLVTLAASCKSNPETSSSTTSKTEGSSNGTTEAGETGAGTGASETDAQPGAGTTASGTGNTKAATGSPAAGTKMNLKGRTITIMLYGGSEVFTDSAEGIYKESFGEAASKYNCKFVVKEKPINDLISSVEQAHMAGTAPFDAAMVEGYHVIPKMALSGQYLCLSDYYNFKDGVWNNSIMSGVGEYQGKRYGLPIGLSQDMGIFYNKALLKKANQTDPWTYVKNNTWNWTQFKKLAKALTLDTNKDGTPEQFGYVSEEPFLQFILANGGRAIDMSSGHGQFKIGDAKSVEAINYVLGLYSEQIIPTVEQIASKGLESAFQAMKTGKVAMFPYGSGYGPWLMDEAKMKASDVGWIYFPKGPKATDYVAPILTPQANLMVLKNVKNPKEVVTALQDAMAFWSPNHKTKKTTDQIRTRMAERDAYLDFLVGDHLTMYKNLANKAVCTNTYSYTEANTLIQQMFYDIRTKKYTVQAGINAYKSAITQAIKDKETVE